MMTREEAIEILKTSTMRDTLSDQWQEAYKMAIKALEREPSRDTEEIREIMECDADAETKCKMISNILTAKPHYFEKQEPILDKIKGYISHIRGTGLGKKKSLEFIEKFVDGLKAESEDKK